MQFHRNSGYAEQGDSLAARLVEANVRHGDEAELELVGVGVHNLREHLGITTLAFCPVIGVTVSRMIQRGLPGERDRPIPDVVQFSRSGRQFMRTIQDRQGFARLQCRVRTNGRIHLSGLRIVEFFPYGGTVSGTHSFRDYLAQTAT